MSSLPPILVHPPPCPPTARFLAIPFTSPHCPPHSPHPQTGQPYFRPQITRGPLNESLKDPNAEETGPGQRPVTSTVYPSYSHPTHSQVSLSLPTLPTLPTLDTGSALHVARVARRDSRTSVQEEAKQELERQARPHVTGDDGRGMGEGGGESKGNPELASITYLVPAHLCARRFTCFRPHTSNLTHAATSPKPTTQVQQTPPPCPSPSISLSTTQAAQPKYAKGNSARLVRSVRTKRLRELFASLVRGAAWLAPHAFAICIPLASDHHHAVISHHQPPSATISAVQSYRPEYNVADAPRCVVTGRGWARCD